jgi:RHS repeat-associated protein
VIHPITYVYNAAGLLESAADENMGTLETATDTYTYDAAGRVTGETQQLPGLTPVITLSDQYTAGNRTQLAAAIGGTNDFVNNYQYQGISEFRGRRTKFTDIIYPNGRDVQYGYGTAGAVDDIMSRLETISDGSGTDGTYSAYTYLGAGTIASEDYQQPQVKLDYSADDFAAWDRFGQVVDQIWSGYGSNNSGTLDGYSYTYDRAGNRTSRTNLLDSALSETYQYDRLNRLTQWDVNSVEQQTWTLDSLGNDLSAGTYDAANEETPNQGSSGYDLAGNMTTLSTGDTAKYDAWNRMAEVDNASGGIVEKYAYDGTNRRIQIFSDFSGSTPGTVTDDYLAGQQVIESDVTTGGVRNGGYQFIWSPRYIDAPILRDTLNTSGTGIVAAERVFYLGDANYNVTALVRASGQVVERYTYTAYGVLTVYDSNWANPTATSSVGNARLFAGMDLDAATGEYYDDARFYAPTTGRFLARDPAQADLNLYRYCVNDPMDQCDPTGTQALVSHTVTATLAGEVSFTVVKRHGWSRKYSFSLSVQGTTCVGPNATATKFGAGSASFSDSPIKGSVIPLYPPAYAAPNPWTKTYTNPGELPAGEITETETLTVSEDKVNTRRMAPPPWWPSPMPYLRWTSTPWVDKFASIDMHVVIDASTLKGRGFAYIADSYDGELMGIGPFLVDWCLSQKFTTTTK